MVPGYLCGERLAGDSWLPGACGRATAPRRGLVATSVIAKVQRIAMPADAPRGRSSEASCVHSGLWPSRLAYCWRYRMAVPRLAVTTTGSGYSSGLPGNFRACALRHCSLSWRNRVKASTARATSLSVSRREVSHLVTRARDASPDGGGEGIVKGLVMVSGSCVLVALTARASWLRSHGHSRGPTERQREWRPDPNKQGTHRLSGLGEMDVRFSEAAW